MTLTFKKKIMNTQVFIFIIMITQLFFGDFSSLDNKNVESTQGVLTEKDNFQQENTNTDTQVVLNAKNKAENTTTRIKLYGNNLVIALDTDGPIDILSPVGAVNSVFLNGFEIPDSLGRSNGHYGGMFIDNDKEQVVFSCDTKDDRWSFVFANKTSGEVFGISFVRYDTELILSCSYSLDDLLEVATAINGKRIISWEKRENVESSYLIKI